MPTTTQNPPPLQPSAEDQIIAKNIPKDDLATASKTIYDASGWEIFWRNFLAGMSRGFGTIILYLIFLMLIGTVFVQTILPRLKPFIEGYKQTIESLGNLTNPGQPTDTQTETTIQLDPNTVKQILEQQQK